MPSISPTFYTHIFCQYFGAKEIAKPNVIREKLLNLLSYEKRVRKMLMKLTHARFSKNYRFLSTFSGVIFLQPRILKPTSCNKIRPKLYLISHD